MPLEWPGPLSLAASLPGPLLPSPWGPSGKAEKGSLRLYQSQEMLHIGVSERSVWNPSGGQPGAKRNQGSRASKSLLAFRMLDKGQGVAFKPKRVPQGERVRPEGWHSWRHQAHWRPWEA